MANLRLESVTVDFPIYNPGTRSLEASIAASRRRREDCARCCRQAPVRACARRRESRVRGMVIGSGSSATTGPARRRCSGCLPGCTSPGIGRVWRRGWTVSLLRISLGVDSESTGYENIMSRGLFLGLKPEQLREHMDEIAEFTELGDYLAMPVHTYSSGMRLRLAFAVCTAFEPEILLMDEWLSVGDRSFVEKARRRLEEFVDRAGILILASQHAALLQRICATGVLLEAGRVKARGPIDDVVEEYERLS